MTGKNILTLEKLASALSDSQRNVKMTKAYFKTLPATIPEYNHFTPSNCLFNNQAALDETDEDVEVTLSRFEKLFEKLNSFL